MRHLLCLVTLFCLDMVNLAGAYEYKIKFSQVALCPSSNTSLEQLSKLEGVQDPRTCFVACAESISCSVLYHANGICYFARQLSSLFTANSSSITGPCMSHIRHTVKSKLVVLFDFRKGFSNLVNPGTFDATPYGTVTRDAQGTNFAGTISDFIEVDTRNGTLVSEYLDHPSNFSFFAKVVRQTMYQSSYHFFYDCASNSSLAGLFGDRNGRAWVEHRFLSLATYPDNIETRQSGQDQILHDGTPQAVSLGAAFLGKTLSNFYINGSYLATEDDKAWGLSSEPRCLRLGFHLQADASLKGRMICYAIARAALSTLEFLQLDLLCPW